MTVVSAREIKDVRKQFLLTETNALKLKEMAQAHNVSENHFINNLIRFEYTTFKGGKR